MCLRDVRVMGIVPSSPTRDTRSSAAVAPRDRPGRDPDKKLPNLIGNHLVKTVLRTSQAGRKGKVAQLGSNLLQTMHLIADILGLNWRRHSMMGLQEKRKSSLPRSVYFNFPSSYPPTRPPSSPKELDASRCSRLLSPEHFNLRVGLWKKCWPIAFEVV